MKALVVCKHPDEKKASRACKIIEDHFDVLHAWKDTVTKQNLENVDVVVGIGGDGTTLSASHYVTDKPLVGVNSDPKKSEGALTNVTLKNLKNVLHAVERGEHKEELLQRITVSINGKEVDELALNEVYVGHDKAYRTSKYILKFKGVKEEHRSSGVLVTTGTGSTAWYASAGKKPFSRKSKLLKLLVREPYKGKIYVPTVTHASIKPEEFVEIKVLVPSIVVLDSIREIHVNVGDIVRIRAAKYPLLRVIG